MAETLTMESVPVVFEYSNICPNFHTLPPK